MHLAYWILVFLGFFCSFAFCAPVEHKLRKPMMEKYAASYDKLLRELRENWESPIPFLKKRGYIPKGIDSMFAEKLNAKRQEAQQCITNVVNHCAAEKQKGIHENSLRDNLATKQHFKRADNPSQVLPASLILRNYQRVGSTPPLAKANSPPPPKQKIDKAKTDGFLKKLKDKIMKIFTRQSKDSKDSKHLKQTKTNAKPAYKHPDLGGNFDDPFLNIYTSEIGDNHMPLMDRGMSREYGKILLKSALPNKKLLNRASDNLWIENDI